MKMIITLSALFFGSSAALAAPSKPCPGQLGLIHNGKARATEVSKASYAFAKQALAHYRANELGGFNNQPYIEATFTYLDPMDRVTGYKFLLTDGGDESLTTYYFNSSGKIVYAKYNNQSPLGFWFCGQKTALVVEK